MAIKTIRICDKCGKEEDSSEVVHLETEMYKVELKIARDNTCYNSNHSKSFLLCKKCVGNLGINTFATYPTLNEKDVSDKLLDLIVELVTERLVE